MEGDLASLVEMYHLAKKSGSSATLILSSKRGAATVAKLEIELDDATPSLSTSTTQSSTPTAPAPGKQRRRRGLRLMREQPSIRQPKQSQKGKPPATGRAHSPRPPPPPPPLPPATRRLVTAVGRTTSPRASFSQVDGAQETSDSESEWLELDKRLSGVMAEVSGVCDTCDDHHLEVTEDCYFLCQGKSDCFQIIRPICNGCKWMAKRRRAQEETDTSQNDDHPCD